MNKIKTGDRSNMVTILSRVGNSKFLIQCDCGNEKEILRASFRRKFSCGCTRKKSTGKHGLSKTRFYNIWNAMTQRCNNSNNHAYINYGGRGIQCEWDKIEDFYKDMKEGYSEELSIDRIDNNKNYYKENCRWATAKQQARNTRIYMSPRIRKTLKDNKKYILTKIINKNLIEFNNELHNFSDWCRIRNISISVGTSRVSVMGWSKLEALEMVER